MPSPFEKKILKVKDRQVGKEGKGRREVGRAASLQPATVPAQGHLYKVAGGLKHKGTEQQYGGKKQKKQKALGDFLSNKEGKRRSRHSSIQQ